MLYDWRNIEAFSCILFFPQDEDAMNCYTYTCTHTHTLTHACVHTTGGGLLACGICYACIQDGAVNNNNNNININDNNNERISPVVVQQQCKTQRNETCAEVRDERGNIKRSFR